MEDAILLGVVRGALAHLFPAYRRQYRRQEETGAPFPDLATACLELGHGELAKHR